MTLPERSLPSTGLLAITRAVGPPLADCELTFLPRRPIDVAKAAEQHEAYCQAIREAGVSVRVLPADEHLPDAVFVEDAAVVLDEIAVMTRPRKPIRRMEVPTIAAALTEYRDITHIEAPATLEGGDILIAGRTIFVGLSSRTNQQGLDQFSATVRRYGYRTIPVSVQGCLHLKTAVTALDQDTFLTNPRWIDVDPFRGFRCVEVPEEEPSAANSLALNGVIHLSARSSRTRELLERRGFLTRSLDVTELEKAEAGLTCMSVIFRGERH